MIQEFELQYILKLCEEQSLFLSPSRSELESTLTDAGVLYNIVLGKTKHQQQQFIKSVDRIDSELLRIGSSLGLYTKYNVDGPGYTALKLASLAVQDSLLSQTLKNVLK